MINGENLTGITISDISRGVIVYINKDGAIKTEMLGEPTVIEAYGLLEIAKLTVTSQEIRKQNKQGKK